MTLSFFRSFFGDVPDVPGVPEQTPMVLPESI